MGHLQGHLDLYLFVLQLSQELGLPLQLPVQSLFVRGQLLVGCQVLLIHSHIVLQVARLGIGLGSCFLALDFHCLLHISQNFLQLAHLLNQLSLDVLLLVQGTGELHVVCKLDEYILQLS